MDSYSLSESSASLPWPDSDTQYKHLNEISKIDALLVFSSVKKCYENNNYSYANTYSNSIYIITIISENINIIATTFLKFSKFFQLKPSFP